MFYPNSHHNIIVIYTKIWCRMHTEYVQSKFFNFKPTNTISSEQFLAIAEHTTFGGQHMSLFSTYKKVTDTEAYFIKEKSHNDDSCE